MLTGMQRMRRCWGNEIWVHKGVLLGRAKTPSELGVMIWGESNMFTAKMAITENEFASWVVPKFE